jgi:hypothetical protein
MAGRVLLDTNVIIAFFSGEKAVSQRFMDGEVFVSSTVLGKQPGCKERIPRMQRDGAEV